MPPVRLRHGRTVLHYHHVIPISAGGSDDDVNVVLLCPNHHGVAHRAWTNEAWHGGYIGPKTREEIIVGLRALDAEEDIVDVSRLPF